MEVIILANEQAVAELSALRICELLETKPDAVLGLATGSTPITMYKYLIRLYQKNRISFRHTITFNLDEYIGLAPDNPQSYRTFMNRYLFEHIDIDFSNTYLPICKRDDNPHQIAEQYEQAIEAAGGIDLQILGIGSNGHIGFNEPTSSLSSRTRVKTLTESTVVDNSRLFQLGEYQPHLAMTMGIGTIMDSQRCLLLATGESKADAVRNAIEGPVSAICPASALQYHRHATFVLDEAAASALEHRDYYRWVYQQHTKLLARKFHEAGCKLTNHFSILC